MPTYYFDSVAGSDSNNGLSPSQPLKGISPLISTYLLTGNTINIKRGSVYTAGAGMGVLNPASQSGITIQDYGSGALPWFDARQSIATGAWTYNGSGNIWYRQWAANARVQRVFVGSQDIELIESSHKNGGVSGINGSQTFWYWALDDPAAGSCRLYMWSGSSTQNPTQVWGSVKYCDSGGQTFSNRIMQLIACNDMQVRNIRFSGATDGILAVLGCNNVLLEGVVTDYAPLYGCNLIVDNQGSTDVGTLEVKDCQFLMSGVYRSIYSDAGAGTSNDPNSDPAKNAPYPDNGSNDSVVFRCPANATFSRCYFQYGYHAAINMLSASQSGRDGSINVTVQDCDFVGGTIGPYSRAIGTQRSAQGGSNNILIENSRFIGQLTNTQIAGGNSVIIRNNIFGPCGYGITGSMPDYYTTGRTYNQAGSFRHLSFQTYSGSATFSGGAASVVVEGNQFQGAANSPFNAEWYDGEPASNVIVIRNNHIANVGEPWGDGSLQRIFERRTEGSWVPVIENNTYEGALNPVVGLLTSGSYVDHPINNFGGGNTQQSKTILRPIITPR